MWWPWYARLIYNVTRAEAQEGYVLAAETVGASTTAHPVPRDPAQLLAVDPDQDDARCRLRHPDRLVALLPRPRRAAADAGPRLDGRRWREIHARRLVADGLPGARHPARRASASTWSATACAKPSRRRADDAQPDPSSPSATSASASAAAAGRREVLHGISLHVGAGEKVALVGESGSGKSVTARLAMGLLQDSRGRPRLRLDPLRRHRRRRGRAARSRRRRGDRSGDDLPGPDLGAQSDLHDPWPVPRRAALAATGQSREARGRPARPRRHSRKSRSPIRSARSIPMPSSSPAA